MKLVCAMKCAHTDSKFEGLGLCSAAHAVYSEINTEFGWELSQEVKTVNAECSHRQPYIFNASCQRSQLSYFVYW